ncbi:MAG: hypothetical protein AAGF24_15770, partial [Cyanobacteria bacterium P01_H01_bin.121]
SQISYPREDVVSLKATIQGLEDAVQTLNYQLNLDLDPKNKAPHADSWATNQQKTLTQIQTDLEHLTTEFKGLKTDSQAEYQQLRKESRQAIAQLSEDSKFLENARELIRFFKSA